MVKPRRRATYDDLCKLPEHLVGEIIDGELIASPRPASAHAKASSAIGGELWSPFDRPPGGGGPGGWWILFEPELHFAEDVLVPDLAGWRRERMPRMPNVPAFELAPDWVCEVVSPSTERIDRARKMTIYARVGVSHLWLVNPLVRTLEIYRLEEGAWTLVATHEGDARVRAVPYDRRACRLARPRRPAVTPPHARVTSAPGGTMIGPVDRERRPHGPSCSSTRVRTWATSGSSIRWCARSRCFGCIR